MTLYIVAIDALDAAFVEHFDVDAFRLESTSAVETFGYSREEPFTPEVWATVATGVEPETHGVTGAGTSEWDNPLLEAASRVTAHFPERVRGQLGRFVRSTTGAEDSVGSTDVETMFDREDAVVRNWPGVTRGADLQRAWGLMRSFAGGEGDRSRRSFERELYGQAAEQFGWTREMTNHSLGLVGVHVHIVDAAGHAYVDDEDAYAAVYERVGDFVAELHASLDADDELLLMSDHGMTVSFHSDEDDGRAPGHHSWRAYATATTVDCPSSVYEVVDWVEEHYEPAAARTDEDVDIPTAQLRELGYMD
jgi:hypothetical protein